MNRFEGLAMLEVRVELLDEVHRTAVLLLTADSTLSETSAVPYPCTDAHVGQWIADNRAGGPVRQ